MTKFFGAFALAIALTGGIAYAVINNPGTTNFPDPPSPKDGQLEQFQTLSEAECVNGHNAGPSAPSIVVIPPSERTPDHKGAPGYRVFISCPEGFLRTGIWNPARNDYSTSR